VGRVVSFWIALGVGMASAIAAAVCFTAVYYEGQQAVSAMHNANAVRTASEIDTVTRPQLHPGIILARSQTLAADKVGNTLPWWIAGAVCAALAVAFLTVAVLRRG
jgi:hypothetical protein